jgi:DNA repair exonuclease SbcCD nuclease subunit
MPKHLIVGDPHVTTADLEDCQNLLDLVIKTAQDSRPDNITFLGDLYNTHSVVDTRCIDFWQTNLKVLAGISPVTVILGNHDQCTPTIRHPHALLSHQDIPGVTIIDEFFQGDDFAAMPYYVDPVEFIKVCKENEVKSNFLFCHQTFNGADQGAGFYAKDSVEPSAIPYKFVISGHIHNPMRFGNVWYPGAPRWKTLTDANQDRFIYLLDGKVSKIPTDTVCRRIYKFEDSMEEPAKIELSEAQLKNADIRVDVKGTSKYISDRVIELKAKYKAKCRTFPVTVRKQKVSESEGIKPAFRRFANSFAAPNGTSIEKLLQEVEGIL